MTPGKTQAIPGRTPALEYINPDILNQESENKPENKAALHYSTGKSGVDQIPPDIMMELGNIYSYGEIKYARNNWTNGTDWHEFIGSALRHLYRWMDGEDIDPESNCPHLMHAVWNLVTLRYYQKHGLGQDDRLSTVMLTEKKPTGGFCGPAWAIDSLTESLSMIVAATNRGIPFEDVRSIFLDAQKLSASTEAPIKKCFDDLIESRIVN